MAVPTLAFSKKALARLGLTTTQNVHYQLPAQDLVDDVIRNGDGVLNDTGALVIKTGEFTGRSPKDKFTVKDEVTTNTVNWNDFNIPLEPKYFGIIYNRIIAYLDNQQELWVRDCYACADERYRLNIRVVNEKPAINLFAYNMFLRPTEDQLEEFEPEWTILSAPGLKLDPKECGTRQHNAAVISFKKKMILIAGTGYT